MADQRVPASGGGSGWGRPWPGTVIPVLRDLAAPHQQVTVLAVRLVDEQVRVLLHAGDGAGSSAFATAAAGLMAGADLEAVRAVGPLATALFSRSGAVDRSGPVPLGLRTAGALVPLGRPGPAVALDADDAVLAALAQPDRVQWVAVGGGTLTRRSARGARRLAVLVVARTSRHLLVACTAPHKAADLASWSWPPVVLVDGVASASTAVHAGWVGGHLDITLTGPAPPAGARHVAVRWGDDEVFVQGGPGSWSTPA